MRSPNHEQKKAIEHTGGVLLSAGAGSGKTFVLVEHIIYLLHEFNRQNDNLGKEEYVDALKSYLSTIVLMTFTKKAAGELMLRLNARIETEIQHVDYQQEKWALVRECLDSMTVSTIHGFCYQLLGQGFFPDFDPNIEIISEAQSVDRIEKLFVRWFEVAEEQLANENPALWDTLVSNKQEVISALVEIFSDPSLRIMWENLSLDTINKKDLSAFFQEFFEIMGFDRLFDGSFQIANYQDYSDKKWFLHLQKFIELPLSSLGSKDSYLDILQFFENAGRVQAPRKNLGLTEVNNYFEVLKSFKSFIVSNSESLVAYYDHTDTTFIAWAKKFKEIFDHINKNYKEIAGVTFADLEYYVLNGLKHESICTRIRKSYQYFIVDEFQDTSYVQFSIIKSLINGDYKKLFCVGDIKQAIYGFRGGELGVFLDCSKKIPLNLSMKNNYRSFQNIIKCNNLLFDNIFRKGLEYAGNDSHAVEVEHQAVPLEDMEHGEIVKSVVVIDQPKNEKGKTPKLSTSELNKFEAQEILKKVKNIRQANPVEDVCILYSKLTPTRYLIPLLLKEEIDFAAQIKIPLSEDPVLGIFKILLEGLLEKRADKDGHFVCLLLEGYLKHLKISVDANLQELIGQFYSDCNTLTLDSAYRKMLFSLGVANSNFSNNYSLIRSICRMSQGNIDLVWNAISQNADKRYSIDFQVGNEASKVLIMTTHASKGLEFDNVILGGIHTNGSRQASSSYFGKIPGSYKWKIDSSQKKPFKSPYYILESELAKQKDFAESKRLFYVACTRTKKRLLWIDLQDESGFLSYGKNSWINGIRSWENDFQSSAMELFEHINEVGSSENIQVESGGSTEKSVSNSPPMFHKDSLGINPTSSLSSNDSKEGRVLGCLAELSITRLATLAQCPRKFYLQNICKLDEQELQLVLDANEAEWQEDEKLIREDGFLEEEKQSFSSSAERGTRLHDLISKFIKSNFHLEKVESRKKMNDHDLRSFSWILEELRKREKLYEFVSEEPIKFPLFGHMLTGIPDLILIRKDSDIELEIWDFKTGKSDQQKEQAYWFQLLAYAYACYGLYQIPYDIPVKMVLSYLDEQSFAEKTLTKNEIDDHLYMEWKKLGHLDQVNYDSCQYCQFGNICHVASSHVALD